MKNTKKMMSLTDKQMKRLREHSKDHRGGMRSKHMSATGTDDLRVVLRAVGTIVPCHSMHMCMATCIDLWT